MTDNEQGDPENESKGENSKMNFQTMKKILFWWGMTIPVALVTSYLLTAILFNFVA